MGSKTAVESSTALAPEMATPPEPNALALVTDSVPALITDPPLWVFGPAITSVPVPLLVKLNAPDTEPDRTGALPLATASVLAPVNAIAALRVPVPERFNVPLSDT